MSGSVAVPCSGAAISSWGSIWHWVKANCWSGLGGASDISVMAEPGLAVSEGARPGLAGAVMARPGGSGVNHQ